MTNQVLVLSVCFAVIIVAAIFFTRTVVHSVVENRKVKHAKKMAEKWAREREQQEPEQRAQEDEGPSYVAYVGLSKNIVNYIEFIQMRTKTKSPGEVLTDAMRFYSDIVGMYGPGDKLILYKASDAGGILLRFEPLSRIEKKIES